MDSGNTIHYKDKKKNYFSHDKSYLSNHWKLYKLEAQVSLYRPPDINKSS